MARIVDEGAEAGDLTFFSSVGNSPINTTNYTHIGGRAFQFDLNESGTTTLPSTYSELYVRFYWYNNSSQASRFHWYSSGGTELGSIRVNTTTNALDIYTGSSTLRVSGASLTIPNAGSWILEAHIKIDDAVGVIEFKIDGTLQTGFSGDTKPGSDTTIGKLAWGVGNPGWGYVVDDIAVNDTSGAVDNSWIGDGHYYGLVANGNGDSSQLTGSDGNSTDNYALVDEIPSNSDTDYVEAAPGSGYYDLYALSNLPSLSAGSIIKKVIVEIKAKELTADAQTMQVGVKSGSTESWVTTSALGTSYGTKKVEFKVNPATSSAWTESEVNGMQAGVKVP